MIRLLCVLSIIYFAFLIRILRNKVRFTKLCSMLELRCAIQSQACKLQTLVMRCLARILSVRKLWFLRHCKLWKRIAKQSIKKNIKFKPWRRVKDDKACSKRKRRGLGHTEAKCCEPNTTIEMNVEDTQILWQRLMTPGQDTRLSASLSAICSHVHIGGRRCSHNGTHKVTPRLPIAPQC